MGTAPCGAHTSAHLHVEQHLNNASRAISSQGTMSKDSCVACCKECTATPHTTLERQLHTKHEFHREKGRKLTRSRGCGRVADPGIQWGALAHGEREPGRDVPGPLPGAVFAQAQLHAQHLVPVARVLGQRVCCPAHHDTSARCFRYRGWYMHRATKHDGKQQADTLVSTQKCVQQSAYNLHRHVAFTSEVVVACAKGFTPCAVSSSHALTERPLRCLPASRALVMVLYLRWLLTCDDSLTWGTTTAVCAVSPKPRYSRHHSYVRKETLCRTNHAVPHKQHIS